MVKALNLTILFFIAASIFALPVKADYAGNASTYAQCADFDSGVYTSSVGVTFQDQLNCRKDVACKNNQADKSIPCQNLFEQPSAFDPANFSFVSWVTVFINLATFAILAYWIIQMFRAAITIIGSFGAPDKILEGQKQIMATLRSIAFLFIFLMLIIIAGNFFGIGNIWEWPKSFSQCRNYDNKFYFTVRLENPGLPIVCN
jgi:hypothetical protein